MSLWSGDIHGGIQLPPSYKMSHDNESVKSGPSERSRRSSSSRHHNHTNNVQNHSSYHHQRQQQLKQEDSQQQSYRASRRHSHRSARSCTTQVKVGDRRDEVIEVQILPQDDNWGDNTTAITGNTSERSVSAEDVSRLGQDSPPGGLFRCHMWAGTVLTSVLSLAAFLSPIVMVALPRIEMLEWKVHKCGPECDGLLISFAFKLLILAVATWALFVRRPRATMPRIFIMRAVVLALVFVFIFSYWLFFSVRIYERRHLDYELTYLSIVQFALSLVDSLLFIHYMAVILVEIRQLQPQYYVKMVRSPDGQSRSYSVGQLSIQRAAVWMLEKYYQDFPIYNPYLETVPSRHRKQQQQQQQQAFKVYDVDGVAEEDHAPLNHQTVLPGRRSGHNDRFYEEHEYERRVRKRRARLVSAAEEAFTHIKRMQEESAAGGPAIPMDPTEAAQAIFPSMARALQKYLRITRQQPRHSMQGILEHLSQCLHYDLSPRAFLEKYVQSAPVLQDDRELLRPVQTWALVCDVLLSRPLKPGVTFLLRQGEVSLLVSVHALPHFNVTEEIVDPKSNRFVLRLNSETSV